MGTAQEDNEDYELELSSFLQTNTASWRSRDLIPDSFTEICINFREQAIQMHDDEAHVPATACGSTEYLPMWVAPTHGQDDSEGHPRYDKRSFEQGVSLVEAKSIPDVGVVHAYKALGTSPETSPLSSESRVVYIYIYLCIHIYIYMYIYIHISHDIPPVSLEFSPSIRICIERHALPTGPLLEAFARSHVAW